MGAIYRPTPVIQSTPNSGQDWNMDVGAVAKNLDRAASGGYGGRYGMKPSSGLYEARMAQIKGNFAAKQGQAAEEQRRLEAQQDYRLRSSAIGETRRSNKAAEEARAAEFEKTFGFKESELGALTDYRNRGFEEQAAERERMSQQWQQQFGLNKTEADRQAEQWQKTYDRNTEKSDFELDKAKQLWDWQQRDRMSGTYGSTTGGSGSGLSSSQSKAKDSLMASIELLQKKIYAVEMGTTTANAGKLQQMYKLLEMYQNSPLYTSERNYLQQQAQYDQTQANWQSSSDQSQDNWEKEFRYRWEKEHPGEEYPY